MSNSENEYGGVRCMIVGLGLGLSLLGRAGFSRDATEVVSTALSTTLTDIVSRETPDRVEPGMSIGLIREWQRVLRLVTLRLATHDSR